MKGNERVQKAKMVLLTQCRHPWEHGTAANAFIESGDDHIAVLMAHEAVWRQDTKGRLASLERTNNITDPCACGESVMFAYEKTGDVKYKEAAEKMLAFIENAPANKDGVQYHNFDTPMIAADCMYMVPPFYAVMEKFKQAVRHTDLRFGLLWDPEIQLIRHQWNDAENKWHRDKCWASATSWNIVAIVKILHLLPENMTEERTRLTSYVTQMLDGILKFQLPNGLFHDILDDETSFVETNAAQMVAFAIYRGVQWGLLDDKYIPYANKMREAANKLVDENGFVWGAADAPTFTKSGISPEAQAFYIMMEAAFDDFSSL
jgi:Predicted unsaturated glucuronyl hydrolase involved in regulation of bacterial surface properties, and related proteins